MSIVNLFPTPILKIAVTSDWNRNAILDRLKTYFDKQSVDGIVERQLHKEKVMEPIVNIINQCFPDYWDYLQYDKTWPVEIRSMWANSLCKTNKIAKGNLALANTYGSVTELEDVSPSYMGIHDDNPAYISAVFYVNLDSADMGEIFFVNPNEDLLRTQPLSEKRRRKEFVHTLEVRTGDLILFPSWLKHGTHPNLTDRNRLSIGAKIELKGIDIYQKLLGKV
jgi:Putative 2OG-Fe(II) oxygenase